MRALISILATLFLVSCGAPSSENRREDRFQLESLEASSGVYFLKNMSQDLEAFNLKCKEIEGWNTRDRKEVLFFLLSYAEDTDKKVTYYGQVVDEDIISVIKNGLELFWNLDDEETACPKF